MKWEERNFDEIGTLERGRSRHRPRNFEGLYGGKYPFIQTGEVKAANLYITEYTQTYNERGLEQSRLWEPGTLCITIAANIADTAILGIEACFPDSIIGFKADETKCDVRFVKYFFDVWQKKIQQVSQGATQDNLSMEKLLKFKIPLPPLPTQQKIAAILSAYDDLIENNMRRIKLLEEAAQQMYREWFVRYRFPGWEDAKFGEDGLPEGWERRMLSEICHLTMGQSPSSEYYNENGAGLPFHQGVTNFGDRFVTHNIFCSNDAVRIAAPGDILCSVRAPVGRLNITLDKIVIGRGLSAIRNFDGYQSFQFYLLKNHFVQEDMIGGGTIFSSVTKKELENQVFIYPSGKLIEKFESFSEKLDSQIRVIHNQIQYLKEARDLLLPRLMNHQIEV